MVDYPHSVVEAPRAPKRLGRPYTIGECSNAGLVLGIPCTLSKIWLPAVFQLGLEDGTTVLYEPEDCLGGDGERKPLTGNKEDEILGLSSRHTAWT